MPITRILVFLHQSSILDEFSKLISYLFIITTVFTPKCWATFTTLSKSCNPDRVGSVTTTAKLAPLRVAIRGQPIPGGPSTTINSRSFFSAIVLAFSRTKVTNLPEFSSAIPKWACTKGPYFVSEIYHSPQ